MGCSYPDLGNRLNLRPHQVESWRHIVKHRILYGLSVSLLGYSLLALSAVAVTLVVGLATRYSPCATCFTLSLLTLRLNEIHWTLVLVPPLVAACAMVLLAKAGLNRRIAAGLGLSFPYLLVALVYVLMGAREFPLEIAFAWMVWACAVGAASSVVVNKLAQSLRRP